MGIFCDCESLQCQIPDSLLSELESMVEVQVPEEPEEIELAQLPVARIGRVQRQQE